IRNKPGYTSNSAVNVSKQSIIGTINQSSSISERLSVGDGVLCSLPTRHCQIRCLYIVALVLINEGKTANTRARIAESISTESRNSKITIVTDSKEMGGPTKENLSKILSMSASYARGFAGSHQLGHVVIATTEDSHGGAFRQHGRNERRRRGCSLIDYQGIVRFYCTTPGVEYHSLHKDAIVRRRLVARGLDGPR